MTILNSKKKNFCWNLVVFCMATIFISPQSLAGESGSSIEKNFYQSNDEIHTLIDELGQNLLPDSRYAIKISVDDLSSAHALTGLKSLRDSAVTAKDLSDRGIQSIELNGEAGVRVWSHTVLYINYALSPQQMHNLILRQEILLPEVFDLTDELEQSLLPESQYGTKIDPWEVTQRHALVGLQSLKASGVTAKDLSDRGIQSIEISEEAGVRLWRHTDLYINYALSPQQMHDLILQQEILLPELFNFIDELEQNLLPDSGYTTKIDPWSLTQRQALIALKSLKASGVTRVDLNERDITYIQFFIFETFGDEEPVMLKSNGGLFISYDLTPEQMRERIKKIKKP